MSMYIKTLEQSMPNILKTILENQEKLDKETVKISDIEMQSLGFINLDSYDPYEPTRCDDCVAIKLCRFRPSAIYKRAMGDTAYTVNITCGPWTGTENEVEKLKRYISMKGIHA